MTCNGVDWFLQSTQFLLALLNPKTSSLIQQKSSVHWKSKLGSAWGQLILSLDCGDVIVHYCLSAPDANRLAKEATSALLPAWTPFLQV